MNQALKPHFVSLKTIVEKLGGELISEDPACQVSRVGTLENAKADAISFVSQAKFLPQLATTQAGAVVLPIAYRDASTLPRIITENPYLYFARLSAFLNPPKPKTPGIHPSAVVAASVQCGERVSIGAHVFIGENVRLGHEVVIEPNCVIADHCHIGDNTHLMAQVTLYAHSQIGSRCILHSGVVIGADGFGIAVDQQRWVKVPQLGKVVLGDDVEVGANTTIDRGAIDDTIIEEGVKLDNLIQIAHNVHIGAHTAIAACTGIAGSARIGRWCRIGGSARIAGHIHIADGVEISATTFITKSITLTGTYSGGYPFEPNAQWRRTAVQIRHLDSLNKTVKTLEKRLAALERKVT